MKSRQVAEERIYRTILLSHGGDDILLIPTPGGFALPWVRIPNRQRIAENLTAAVKERCAQEAICLFDMDETHGMPFTPDYGYQVMECVRPANPSTNAMWVGTSDPSNRSFVDRTDQIAVLLSLAECTGSAIRGPFGILGWFAELEEWIKEIIRPLGLRLTNKFSQLNASRSFSLVRFETTGRAVWFKAVGEPNLREFSITRALGQLFPKHISPILAVRPEWNAWLASEVDGKPLGETNTAKAWEVTAGSLASLQIESIGHIELLLSLGARDLRIAALLKQLHPYFDAMTLLMEKQTKLQPPALSRIEMLALRDQISKALYLLAEREIPDSLGHLDLNPGNVIVSDKECVFLDWADAYIGSPLFSHQYLQQQCLRSRGLSVTPHLGRAYAERWRSRVAPEDLERAMTLTSLVAPFAYAIAGDAWFNEVRLEDPEIAGYLRSLTRRMHREASLLRDRSMLCPS